MSNMEFEDLTRDDRFNFLNSPVWRKIRTDLHERKVELYQIILDENSSISKVKSSADKLAMIDEIFNTEKELIESLNIKGEING